MMDDMVIYLYLSISEYDNPSIIFCSLNGKYGKEDIESFYRAMIFWYFFPHRIHDIKSAIDIENPW